MLQSKGYRRWNDWFKSEKPKCRFQIFPSISAFTTLSLLTKLADLNVHKIKTDGRQKWTFLQPHTNFFLILRRNEAERKHTAQINQLQYFFHRLFIRHARYQRVYIPTSQSQKNYNPSHPFFFLSFCIFLLLFQRSRNIVLLPVWGLGQTSALFFLCVPAWSSPRPGMHCAYVYGTTFGLD